ncbi:unnamed protein product [Echinostoma caproni]|uniref:Reverse transcriptase domain-containing protein n=1 Tax=Echinostoma caproni TaxID=27848 RepID=A0A183B707_9TREM|nr:unnamed protein product [Echinostoma caproni]
MEALWPKALEDGDARKFLEEFEEVAKLAGIRSNRVRAVLYAARKGPEKIERAVAKDALIAGFVTPVDLHRALRSSELAWIPCRLPWLCALC